jgi:hypothetical protein
MIPSYPKIQHPFRKVPDICGFIWFHWKKPWFLRVFPYWDGRIQPGAVVGIYENDEAAKTVTELFTKAVELGRDTPRDGSDLV